MLTGPHLHAWAFSRMHERWHMASALRVTVIRPHHHRRFRRVRSAIGVTPACGTTLPSSLLNRLAACTHVCTRGWGVMQGTAGATMAVGESVAGGLRAEAKAM